MRKLTAVLVLVVVLGGCTPGGNEPSPAPPSMSTTPATPTVNTPSLASPVPTVVESTESPAPTSTRDPLDFTDLPENQRPVLACIPVTADEEVNTWPFVDDATGWRIDMGVGNDSSETWSLFMWYSEDQYGNPRTMFWLTNYWSTSKPSGMTAMFVTDGDFSFNAWENDVEWPQARRDSGQAAAEWMLNNCGA